MSRLPCHSPLAAIVFVSALLTAQVFGQPRLVPLGFPDIAVEPASLGVDVPTGTSATTSFLVRNTGNGLLAVQAIDDDALWMTENPAAFTVPASGVQQVTVTVNATALTAGIYNQTISISCNDPDEPTVNIPIRVNVTGVSVPDIWVRPSVIEVTIPSGQSGSASFAVGNGGGAALTVSSVAGDTPWLSMSPTAFTVAPGDSQAVSVQILANPAPGTYSGTISIVSNDPDEPTVSVQVTETMGADVAEGCSCLALADPAPNPFTASTTVRFTLARPGHVTVSVHDLAGRRMTSLLQGWHEAGSHAVLWNGTDAQGRMCPPGVYQVRVRAGAMVRAARTVLIR